MKKIILTLVVVVALAAVIAGILAALRGKRQAKGVSFVVELDVSKLPEARRGEAIAQASETVKKRLVEAGVQGVTVKPIGGARLQVEVPAVAETEKRAARAAIEALVHKESRSLPGRVVSERTLWAEEEKQRGGSIQFGRKEGGSVQVGRAEGGSVQLGITLKKEAFVNSLGMKFVPVLGTDVLFCIWETRVQDYQAFVIATGQSWEKPNFEQGPTHPAVNVSLQDVKAFCAWLTKKEQGEGRLRAVESYRLPTDAEWSVAVGLGPETGSTPREKDGKIKDVYPWGKQWPPPRGAGSYDSRLKVDDYEYTSPVGSFAANEFGLFDMGGNVWEWCEDLYEPGTEWRVVRGASWYNGTPGRLLSSRRGALPGLRNVCSGFRCVLVVGSSSSR